MTEPLLILSHHHEDELRRLARKAGWDPCPAGLAAGAQVLLLDSRSETDAVGALRSAAALLDPGAAIVVIVPQDRLDQMEAFEAEGATHLLKSPFVESEFAFTLRSAARHVRLVSGRERRGSIRTGPLERALPTGGSRDSATGLNDRRTFLRLLGDQLNRRSDAVIILLSINRHDTINAAFGRETGDALLKRIAARLAAWADRHPGTPTLARLSGDGFGILLDHGDCLDRGRSAAALLVEELGQPIVINDHLVSVGIRASVASAAPGDDAPTLLRRALLARTGARSPISVIDPAGTRVMALDDRLAVDLRLALARGEVEIRYQPQVEIKSGRTIGVEALARWLHPVLGEIGAETLFRVAAQSDYLSTLSDYLQSRAIAEAAAWPQALGALRLALNVTAGDLLQPGFAPRLLRRVADAGLSPARLTVEVTEDRLVEDLGAAAELLGALRKSGIHVAVDDFGTGYSSLTYVHALPLDCLKLDRSFLGERAPGDHLVLRSIVTLARSLGLEVVAEGVENEAQLRLVAAAGATHYQGFYRSPPIGRDDLIALITRESSPAPC